MNPTSPSPIQVEDRAAKPGVLISLALIGPSLDAFEIRVDGTVAHYLVNHLPVSREVYFDALRSLHRDRYDPDLFGDDEEEKNEDEETTS